MKWIIIVLASAGIIGLGFITKKKTGNQERKVMAVPVQGSYEPVAILELFTSEGCSSCPSADRLLPQLAGLDAKIIPLSFHVDYWNRLGWKDPFSSIEYSERQRSYARQLNLESVYTPQLVVNGEYELVGSDRSKAESIIKKVLEKKAAVQLSLDKLTTTNGKLHFKVHTQGDFKKTNLLAALVQRKVTMNIRSGENGGATLSHTNVVRTFAMQTTKAANEFEIELPADTGTDNWQLIVYTQQKTDLKITGAILYDPKTK